MAKMKVLSIQVDVSDLTDQEVEDLEFAMQVQCEDAGGTDDSIQSFDAPILNSAVKEIEYEECDGQYCLDSSCDCGEAAARDEVGDETH